MIIDAHQHVWDLTRASYEWPTATEGSIFRSIEYDEIVPTFTKLGVSGSILVQANDSREDTDYLLEVAQAHPEVLGVVGYVPLHEPERAAAGLAEFVADSRIVGIRNLIHNRKDPAWLRRPEVQEGLGLLAESGLSFDVVAVTLEHLEQVIILAEKFPTLRMVIDHLGKPPIKKPPIKKPEQTRWWALIAEAAQSRQVFGKLSGLYPAMGDLSDWKTDDIRPFFERAVDVFGADRLMYGSDWPVSILAGGYERVWAGLQPLWQELPAIEQGRILGGTAAEFYGLGR